jgi:hypothetical protein
MLFSLAISLANEPQIYHLFAVRFAMREVRLTGPEMQTSYEVSLARVRDLEMS